MRFVVTGEWRTNNLLRLVLACFALYVALFWITNWVLYFLKMGLSYESVVAHYRGAEERFLSPRTFAGLAEVSHFHLFAIGILLLTLTHLVLFVPLRDGLKAAIIVASFGAALADESAGWLVRFVHPAFAYMKIASFLTLQLALAVLEVLVVYAVWAGPPNAYEEQRRDVRRPPLDEAFEREPG